jgi:hypothetical protein
MLFQCFSAEEVVVDPNPPPLRVVRPLALVEGR